MSFSIFSRKSYLFIYYFEVRLNRIIKLYNKNKPLKNIYNKTKPLNK